MVVLPELADILSESLIHLYVHIKSFDSSPTLVLHPRGHLHLSDKVNAIRTLVLGLTFSFGPFQLGHSLITRPFKFYVAIHHGEST